MESTLRVKREHTGGYKISGEEQVSNICPIEAYDPVTGAFHSDDKRLSGAFLCVPLVGQTQSGMRQHLSSFLQADFPIGTLLSFSLFKSSDVKSFINAVGSIRQRKNAMGKPLYQDFIADKLQFVARHSVEPMGLKGWKAKICNQKVIVSIRVPTSSYMASPRELDLFQDLMTQLSASLDSLQLQPIMLDGKAYVRLMQSILNWGPRASWRRSATPEWDEEVLINHQIFDTDNELQIGRTGLQLGNHHIKVLSAKKFPGTAYMGDALSYVGNVFEETNSIPDHYIVTTNLYFPDPQAIKRSLNTKQTNIANLLRTGIGTLRPSLHKSKRDLDLVIENVKIHRAVQCSLHIAVFSDTEASAKRSAQTVEDTWAARDWVIKPETTIPYPTFVNCLPLCADPSAIKELFRYKTLTSKEVPVLLPLFGDWQGNPRHPTMQYLSRNGQVVGFDLRKMGSPSPHFIVTAETGGGKSFFMNDVLMSYATLDAQEWIIDVGRSYEKLCEVADGTFTCFDRNSKISLNPFSIIDTRDPAEDLTLIAELLHAMAADNEQPLTNLHTSVLKTSITDCFARYGTQTTIDHVSDLLKGDKDLSIIQLGRQLEPWTQAGMYGKWFSGPNNASFREHLNVIELEELKSQKTLQRVVLLALINTIQREVYQGEKDRIKIILIDEAWDLLNTPLVAGFIEGMYRRARKYGGIIGIVTQTLGELTATASGRAIVANAPNKIMLTQSDDTIESMRKKGETALGEYEFSLLKTLTLRKGEYSEIYLKTDLGAGVVRFVASERAKLLYSTEFEEVQAITMLRREGKTVAEAIDILLEQKRGRPVIVEATL